MLLLNINNTFTKIARSSGLTLGNLRRKLTAEVDADWLATLHKRNDRVIAASVVPAKTALLREVFGKHLLLAEPGLDLGRLTLDYPGVKTLGGDRIAALTAAAHEYEGDRIILDCGTAVTVNLLTRDHRFIGGIIAPGFRLFRQYLPEKTAALPSPNSRHVKSAIGKTTQESLNIGVYLGFEGMVNHLVRTAAAEAHFTEPSLILTGGDAKQIASRAPFFHALDETLTMSGLIFLSQFNP